ncbi:phage tail tape measure protein [Sporanaerobium hydrogeniformans]|uniref:Phage tail tape measure protein n=1 Tax=Sporanaerobium hydrogeniformans TaxID=3072179 RepID=A0AC61D8V8_9FIRM|nr:phage tail tape measure protein [Sporanaerobium hydrogeniformans]PHV69781.1 phage tail tape measure protein [Sporanaerobium hydrogeniformans]
MSNYKGYKRTIQLDFNYDKVKEGVSKVNQQMALLNAEFRKTSAQVEASGNSFDKLGIKQELSANKVKIQKDKISELERELEKLNTAENKNEKAIASKTIELKNAQAQLMKMEKELKNVNEEVAAQTSKLGIVSTKWSDFKSNMNDAGINMEELGVNLTKVGLAMASVGAIGTTMSINFDQSIVKSRTIMDETQVSYENLRKGALRVSSDVNMAANDVANGLYDIISSNIETKDSLVVLEASAKNAKAGFTDVATSADLLTTMLNAYKKEAKDATMYSDQLVITQKLAKATIGDLGKDFGKVAGLAATAKVEFAQVGAAVAVLTTNGIKSNEAITGLKAVLSAVVKPSAEAKKAAEEMGLKFNITNLQAKGLADFLGEVQNKCKGNTEEMAKLFGSVEALNAVLVLTNKEGMSQFNSNLQTINNSSGATEEALSKLKTPGEELSKSFNNLKNTMIEVGDSFAPVVTLVAGFFSILGQVPPGVLVTIAVLGTMIATIGGVITAINSTMTAVSNVSTIAAKVSGGLSPMESKILKIGAAVMVVVLALTALLAIWAVIRGRSNEVKSTMDSIGNSFSNMNSNVDEIKRSAYSSNSRGFATGTNFVKENGMYRVNEYGQEEIYLPRGSKVKNASQTRSEMQNTDMSETNSLLKTLIAKVDSFERTTANLPRTANYLNRGTPIGGAM